MGVASERAVGWSGDLRDLRMTVWPEPESSVAAIVVTGAQGQARCWINQALCSHPLTGRLVWLWCRRAAYHRPPFDLLDASELIRLADDVRLPPGC